MKKRLILIMLALCAMLTVLPMNVSAVKGMPEAEKTAAMASEAKKPKAVFDFTIAQKVRLSGGTDRTWKDSIDAKVGDKLEFRIEYKNTSDKQQDNVAIKDILPANLKYIKGTTILKNSLHSSGLVMDQDYLVENGLLIGNYAPKANAFIYFAAEVVDDNLEVGANTLTNWSQVGVGDVTIQDSVDVRVKAPSVKVKKIQISRPSSKITVGKTITLKAKVTPSSATNKAVTWKSSNKKYATVDKNGKVTAKKAGKGKTVKITAKAKDGSGKSASVTIKIQ